MSETKEPTATNKALTIIGAVVALITLVLAKDYIQNLEKFVPEPVGKGILISGAIALAVTLIVLAIRDEKQEG